MYYIDADQYLQLDELEFLEELNLDDDDPEHAIPFDNDIQLEERYKSLKEYSVEGGCEEILPIKVDRVLRKWCKKAKVALRKKALWKEQCTKRELKAHLKAEEHVKANVPQVTIGEKAVTKHRKLDWTKTPREVPVIMPKSEEYVNPTWFPTPLHVEYESSFEASKQVKTEDGSLSLSEAMKNVPKNLKKDLTMEQDFDWQDEDEDIVLKYVIAPDGAIPNSVIRNHIRDNLAQRAWILQRKRLRRILLRFRKYRRSRKDRKFRHSFDAITIIPKAEPDVEKAVEEDEHSRIITIDDTTGDELGKFESESPPVSESPEPETPIAPTISPSDIRLKLAKFKRPQLSDQGPSATVIPTVEVTVVDPNGNKTSTEVLPEFGEKRPPLLRQAVKLKGKTDTELIPAKFVSSTKERKYKPTAEGDDSNKSDEEEDKKVVDMTHQLAVPEDKTSDPRVLKKRAKLQMKTVGTIAKLASTAARAKIRVPVSPRKVPATPEEEEEAIPAVPSEKSDGAQTLLKEIASKHWMVPDTAPELEAVLGAIGSLMLQTSTEVYDDQCNDVVRINDEKSLGLPANRVVQLRRRMTLRLGWQTDEDKLISLKTINKTDMNSPILTNMAISLLRHANQEIQAQALKYLLRMGVMKDQSELQRITEVHDKVKNNMLEYRKKMYQEEEVFKELEERLLHKKEMALTQRSVVEVEDWIMASDNQAEDPDLEGSTYDLGVFLRPGKPETQTLTGEQTLDAQQHHSSLQAMQYASSAGLQAHSPDSFSGGLRPHSPDSFRSSAEISKSDNIPVSSCEYDGDIDSEVSSLLSEHYDVTSIGTDHHLFGVSHTGHQRHPRVEVEDRQGLNIVSHSYLHGSSPMAQDDGLPVKTPSDSLDSPTFNFPTRKVSRIKVIGVGLSSESSKTSELSKFRLDQLSMPLSDTSSSAPDIWNYIQKLNRAKSKLAVSSSRPESSGETETGDDMTVGDLQNIIKRKSAGLLYDVRSSDESARRVSSAQLNVALPNMLETNRHLRKVSDRITSASKSAVHTPTVPIKLFDYVPSFPDEVLRRLNVDPYGLGVPIDQMFYLDHSGQISPSITPITLTPSSAGHLPQSRFLKVTERLILRNHSSHRTSLRGVVTPAINITGVDSAPGLLGTVTPEDSTTVNSSNVRKFTAKRLISAPFLKTQIDTQLDRKTRRFIPLPVDSMDVRKRLMTIHRKAMLKNRTKERTKPAPVERRSAVQHGITTRQDNDWGMVYSVLEKQKRADYTNTARKYPVIEPDISGHVPNNWRVFFTQPHVLNRRKQHQQLAIESTKVDQTFKRGSTSTKVDQTFKRGSTSVRVVTGQQLGRLPENSNYQFTKCMMGKKKHDLQHGRPPFLAPGERGCTTTCLRPLPAICASPSTPQECAYTTTVRRSGHARGYREAPPGVEVSPYIKRGIGPALESVEISGGEMATGVAQNAFNKYPVVPNIKPDDSNDIRFQWKYPLPPGPITRKSILEIGAIKFNCARTQLPTKK